ncbi:IclR family transcriptional regulator C-terminal domain-containing protein [Streptomyces sp. NPDC029003]|uniref:IclR family transcriptional regulator domain-containing protein n=1 Tax=Streptomyces sp. NPDC029003 TaxID=3155125 RepID=UPI003408A00B
MRPREHTGVPAGPPRALAEFLARAGVRDRYPHYDLGAAESRLLRTPRVPGAPAPAARNRRRPFGWSDPARDCPLDSERARRDLKAACLVAVCDPRAGQDLGRFLDSGHADPPGAAVFGCLLHLAGLREGSRFWWQFAAGAGTRRTAPAAYCLFLDHSRRGEHHDARFWARELGRRDFRPGGRRELREIRLCAQAAVLRHVDQHDDPDLGPVPLPRPGLPSVLAAFLPPSPLPARRPRPDPRPLRHPALTSAARATVVQSDSGDALAHARRALAVVRVLERHPLGVRAARLARDSGLTEQALRPLLTMLCEEEYACRPGAGVYARGPALERLGASGGTGLAAQLQRTLALARDSAGAAVYLSRYAEGEVRITQMADGPGAPPVREWVDFRAAAHASAVGKCLLTQLDHHGRADHVTRHRPARLTARTITDSRTLFGALDALTPGAPVFDLREYSPGVVCAAVPIATGGAAGSLALSLPASHAHRLPSATEALRHKAVPVLLALLLSGAIPPDPPPPPGPRRTHTPPHAHPAGPAPSTRITPETLRLLGRLFRTPLTRVTAQDGPHLVNDPASAAAYLFEAEPDPTRLTLPRTFTDITPGSLPHPDGLVVLRM